MGETFAFYIAEKVLGKLGSLAYEEIFLAWGVKSELSKLEGTLTTIKAVLLDAEEKQAKNHQLSVWLGKLKDVCYDVDDVLDEFEYEALLGKVVNSGGIERKVQKFFSSSNSRDIKRKVQKFFSSSNSLAFRFKMGHKIKGIREKLDEIVVEKNKFNLTERVENRHVARVERETHSFVQASEVIGRDDDNEKIVQLLMETSDHENENVSVIPIVGLGGLGKTTLAKSVYNDGRVNSYFQLKMWVCVSDYFDVKDLTKKIINSATHSNCGDLTIDEMQNRLRDTLEDKCFLLILDDVWNEDRVKWIELKTLLMVGASGSKIIVTTRSESVANTMRTVPTHKLEGLSNKDSMSLFVKWAFRKGEEKIYPNLSKIGEEIVKKCKGVPLAVRTLGGLLFSKTDERDWVSIRDNEIWKLEQKENDILPSLRLSYDAMPSDLKQCFAFCSIFPKDFEFESYLLVQLWMAQGFLQLSNENQELEDIGEQYIRELRWRSFFQDFEEQWGLQRFKMHDLVHDLALLVTESECSTIISRHSNISNRLRHVTFVDEKADLSGLQRQLHNLRTIRWARRSTISESLVETFISRFKYLRVLDLSHSHFKVLSNSINKLKHLRYLDLSENHHIKMLPSSICKLVHLQTLILGCGKLEELPRDIGNLIRLRFLVLTTKQTILPAEEIGHLNSLRSLWIVHCHNLKSLSEEILKSLTALRALCIGGCGRLESLSHGMKYLTRLETLVISDCEKLNLMELEEDFDQGLTLSLRSLVIEGFPQLLALPRWLQAASNTLQRITISDCKEFRALPEWLPNLTSLHKLELDDCPELLISPEDWPKISPHIPEITIDDRRIKSIDDLMKR